MNYNYLNRSQVDNIRLKNYLDCTNWKQTPEPPMVGIQNKMRQLLLNRNIFCQSDDCFNETWMTSNWNIHL